MPTPAAQLPADLIKLATDTVDEVDAATGADKSPMEGAEVEEPTEDGMGMMGVPPEFLAAAMKFNKDGMGEEQVARILSGMMASGMIAADDNPKKVGAEFKRVIGSPKKLLDAIGAASDMPAPAGGGEVL